MDQILSYVKPELLIVVVVLYFIGVMIKKSENISDKFIPMILGILGVLICGLYVLQHLQFPVHRKLQWRCLLQLHKELSLLD